MSEFWLWFWRPIAETLGVLTLLAVIGLLYLVIKWLLEQGKPRG